MAKGNRANAAQMIADSYSADAEPDWLAEAERLTRLASADATKRDTASTDTFRLHRLLKALAAGNYLETAALTAGYPKQTIYAWRKRAEQGDIAAIAICDALERASAFAEQEVLDNVKRASKLPQFWAAGMTLLERRHPERWGRRNEDSSSPKVIVQFGVKDSDIRVVIGESATEQHTLKPSADTPALPESLQVVDTTAVVLE